MTASLFVTILRVIPSEGDPDPPPPGDNLVARFATTAVSNTTGTVRTAITMEFVAGLNDTGATLSIPFTWTVTNAEGTVRGADWALYDTSALGSGFPYLGDTFDVPVNASSKTLYLQSNIATGLGPYDVALTLMATGGSGSDLPVGTEIAGADFMVAIVLNGEQATATIEFPVTSGMGGEHETITATALIAPAATGAATFLVNRAGIAYTTEYTATYIVFDGDVSHDSGNLSTAATTVTVQAGDDRVAFYLDGVLDEVSDGDGDVTLTIDTPSAGLLIGASPNDVFTGTFEDTSEEPALIRWEIGSQQILVAEPPYDPASNTTTSEDHILALVEIIGKDDLNDISVVVSVVAGSATEGADFSLLTTSVTFAAGSTAPIPVWVRVTGNDNFEFNETVTLRLSNLTTSGPSPRVINPHTIDTSTDGQDFSFTIISTDPAPEMQFESAAVTRDSTGTFNAVVRMNHLSNLDHTVTVSAPVLGGGAPPGAVDPLASTDLLFPALTTQQRLFGYTINSQPAPGGTDWTATFTLSVLPADGATIPPFPNGPVGNLTHTVTIEAPAVIEPTIGFRTPIFQHIEDGLVYSTELEVSNNQTLEAGSSIAIVIEDTGLAPGGGQSAATRGTDWDIVVSDTDMTVVQPTAGTWGYTLTQGQGPAHVYYRLYDTSGAEATEYFRLRIIGVTASGTQLPFIEMTADTHLVAITDSEPSPTGEALHGMAPIRQAYDPFDPDIRVHKNAGNTGGIIIWKRYPARGIPSDMWSETPPGLPPVTGTTQFAYGSGDSGVTLAIRFARHIWALKNAGKNSGYVNPWDNTITQPANIDDLNWLQNIANMPTEGMNPVTIFLDSSITGHADFYQQFSPGAAQMELNHQHTNQSRSASWDDGLGLPHMRDLIIYGEGRDVTDAPAHRVSGTAGRAGSGLGFPAIPQNYGGFGFPAEDSTSSWQGRLDNFRWEKLTFKYRDNGQTTGGSAECSIIQSNNTQNGLIKLYDVTSWGKENEYSTNVDTYTKWGVNSNGTSMPDYRNCMFMGSSEHSWYQKAARPHGWYIDCWQVWSGNGAPQNANASQMSRHVDRGLGMNDGQAYYSGGLANSMLLNLRCHGRNNGYNFALNVSVSGDTTVKWEGFNGTAIRRNCITTGRFGQGGANGVVDGESDTSPMHSAFNNCDGRGVKTQSGTPGLNGCPLFDYGDGVNGPLSPGIGEQVIEYQSWPMGHPRPGGELAILGVLQAGETAVPGAYTDTMVATSALVHAEGTTTPANTGPAPSPPTAQFLGVANGTPGSRYYPQELNQGVTDNQIPVFLPVFYQSWGPNWWHFRKILLWNETVRQDTAPANGTGSDKMLFYIAGAREVEIRVDADILTAGITAPNGGIDYAGNAIGTDEPITGNIRMLGGQAREQLAMRIFTDGSNALGTGLWTWNLSESATKDVWDDTFWDDAVNPGSTGPKFKHGLDAGELDSSQATNSNIFTLTEPQLNVYDGNDPT